MNQNDHAKIPKNGVCECGRNRTFDPRLKRPLLYHLSYAPDTLSILNEQIY